MKKILIVIIGPTATAKSRIAKIIANQINGALINCDAYQVFKELNIGINKTDFLNFHNPKYLFEFKNLDEDYSIQTFQKDARCAIEKCWNSNYVPILVGGSILYALSCIKDFQYSKQRTSVNNYLNKTNEELHKQLFEIDPEEAKRTHQNNRTRVIRALEVYDNEGISKTEYNKKQNQNYFYKDMEIFSFYLEKEKLNSIIEKRVEEQFDKGLVLEVQELQKKYDRNLTSLQAIGYKEIISGMNNNLDIEIIKKNIIKNNKKYAKKQVTFLKQIKNINYIKLDLDNLENTANAVICLLKSKKLI